MEASISGTLWIEIAAAIAIEVHGILQYDDGRNWVWPISPAQPPRNWLAGMSPRSTMRKRIHQLVCEERRAAAVVG